MTTAISTAIAAPMIFSFIVTAGPELLMNRGPAFAVRAISDHLGSAPAVAVLHPVHIHGSDDVIVRESSPSMLLPITVRVAEWRPGNAGFVNIVVITRDAASVGNVPPALTAEPHLDDIRGRVS